MDWIRRNGPRCNTVYVDNNIIIVNEGTVMLPENKLAKDEDSGVTAIVLGALKPQQDLPPMNVAY